MIFMVCNHHQIEGDQMDGGEMHTEFYLQI